MRKLLFVVLFLALCSDVLAFDSQNFRDSKLQNSYSVIRADFEVKYRKVFPLTKTEQARIVRYEKSIIDAFKKADAAKSIAKQKSTNARVSSQIRALDNYLINLEKARKRSITNLRTPNTHPTNSTNFPSTKPGPVTTSSSPSSPVAVNKPVVTTPVTPQPAPVVTPAPVFVPASGGTTPTYTPGTATGAQVVYYADSFEGGGTANGNRFRQAGFSAARCNIDLNTLVQVRHNGKWVLVKVNDRPNCTKHPNIIDLTTAAFGTLAPLSRGRLEGTVVTLGTISKAQVKEFFPTDFFSNFQIQLDANLPDFYLPNETLQITGNTTGGSTETLMYIMMPSGKSITLGQDNVDGSRFEYYLPLTEVGDYQLVVASGRSFSATKSLGFTVIDPSVIGGKVYEGNTSTTGVVNITGQRVVTGDLTPTSLLDITGLPENTLRGVKIATSNAVVSRTGMWKIAFNPREFSQIADGSQARVEVTARSSSTSYSMDTYTNSTTVLSGDYTLSPAYSTEKHENISSSVQGSTLTVRLGKGINRKIRNHAYIITPSGWAEEVSFESRFLGSNGMLATNDGASFTYNLTENGVYLVEVLYDTGFAAYIAPVQNGKVLSILPNVYDLASKDISTNISGETTQMLASINAARAKKNLAALSLDSELSRLALFKASDMANNNYVGHTDSQWGSILDTANRAGIAIENSIGENVAGGSVGAGYLQAGLLLSGAHRANMLKSHWTKVGIGIVVKNGKASVVQVFTP